MVKKFLEIDPGRGQDNLKQVFACLRICTVWNVKVITHFWF
jgi:hypothetical protein